MKVEKRRAEVLEQLKDGTSQVVFLIVTEQMIVELPT
jgi:hypothetical protein